SALRRGTACCARNRVRRYELCQYDQTQCHFPLTPYKGNAMTTIVLASGNPKKLHELQQMLHGRYVELVPQNRFNVPDVTEGGQSFVGNASLKARHACWLTGMPAIADGSGLEVDVLGGAPGIYSARFASRESDGHSSDTDNNALLLSRLA